VDGRLHHYQRSTLFKGCDTDSSQPSGNVHTSSPVAEFGSSVAILTQMSGKCSLDPNPSKLKILLEQLVFGRIVTACSPLLAAKRKKRS